MYGAILHDVGMPAENAGNIGRLRKPSSFGRAELGGDFAGREEGLT